jgi:hypothetical protein
MNIPIPMANIVPMMLQPIILSVIIPSLGFEPRKRDPKSPVLPLHHEGGCLAAVVVHYDSRGRPYVDAANGTVLGNVKNVVTHT